MDGGGRLPESLNAGSAGGQQGRAHQGGGQRKGLHAQAPKKRQATIIGQSVSTKAVTDAQTATVTAATTQGRVPALSITNV